MSEKELLADIERLQEENRRLTKELKFFYERDEVSAKAALLDLCISEGELPPVTVIKMMLHLDEASQYDILKKAWSM